MIHPTGRARIALGAVAAVLVLGGLAFAARAAGWLSLGGSSEADGAAVPVVLDELEIVVRARGELEAVNAYPVAVPPVPTGALKVARLVDEGATVQTGDVLVVFDETQLEIELDNNMATFRSTERRIDRTRIQSGIESGSIGVMRTAAELELEAAESVRITDTEIFSQREILDASLDREVASEKIVFADISLVLRGKTYDIDEGILQVQKKRAGEKIDRVRTSLATLVLKSPGEGMVVYRKNWRGATVTVGASVWPGNVLMSLVDPSRTALRVFVPEKYATGLEKGQPATVRVDAFADRSYAGTLESVSKLSRPISPASPVKYFEAVIALDEGDPERLKPGMEGEAEIVVRRGGEAGLVIPRAAVRGEGEETFVLVAGRRGEPVRRQVSLGPGDLVRVRVESGLQPGESVLIGEGGPAGAGTGEIPPEAAPES